MGDVLLVSKPITPPWNDSGKNLVRDLAAHMQKHTPTILTRRAAPDHDELPARVRRLAVYPAAGRSYAPGLADNAHVLKELLTGPRRDLWHFFFAPNPRTSTAARLARGLRGLRLSMPTVQTVSSAPHEGVKLAEVLFADRVVVLSAHSEARLREGGIAAERISRVPPSVPPMPAPTEAERTLARVSLGVPTSSPLLVYPGDLEFSGAAERCLEALTGSRFHDATLLIACRPKTREARALETALRSRARELGIEDRVRFLGETRAIHAVLGAADLVLLPAERLYAKMDYPLVLLEAMLLERAVVVVSGTPAAELTEGGAAEEVEATSPALADRIDALLGDDAKRMAIGARARAKALDAHSPAKMAGAYEGIYDALLR